MNLSKIIIISILLFSCGPQPEYISTRTTDTTVAYKRVEGTTITITKKEALQLTMDFDINYTSAEANVFNIDASGMIVTESEDGLILDLGNIVIDNIRKNKLKICGVNNDEKCTSAIIRMYTNDNYDGISGLVNTTYSYSGGDLVAGATSGTTMVGLTDTSALTLAEYTIPANDRKLTKSDFVSASQLMDYDLQIDFSNAGEGDYEISIEIELAVAL